MNELNHAVNLFVRSIQACVVTSLRKNFPGLAVIGEEKEDEVEKDVPADWIVSQEDKEASGMAVPDEYKACTVDQGPNSIKNLALRRPKK